MTPTLAVATSDATYSVSLIGRDEPITSAWHATKWRYRWTITTNGETFTGDDLHSGASIDPAPLADMLGTLFTFLSAFAESIDHADRHGTDPDDTENGTLFPTGLVDHARAVGSDGFTMLSYEVAGDE